MLFSSQLLPNWHMHAKIQKIPRVGITRIFIYIYSTGHLHPSTTKLFISSCSFIAPSIIPLVLPAIYILKNYNPYKSSFIHQARSSKWQFRSPNPLLAFLERNLHSVLRLYMLYPVSRRHWEEKWRFGRRERTVTLGLLLVVTRQGN